jgi:5-dehydro-2-deoxygluconokinase
MTTLKFPLNRPVDLACLGRLAVDLYAQQIGSSLEDARTFSKYLGGSSANLAFGVARLGLRSAMISRVGNEQMGNYLLKTLQQEGCDVSQVQIDPERLTGLVLLGLKDKDTFPLLFVRENCADMAIDDQAISESFIAQCRSLAITGTHLSTDKTRKASHKALELAKRHSVVTVLDIDYRPVLWGLTGLGAGENRFVSDASVTAQLQSNLPLFDLIVGTEEEFLIAGGFATDLIASLKAVRQLTPAVLVLKRGPLGCCILENEIPSHIDDATLFQGERVEVLNVLGAGDAFLSGLMASLLRDKDWTEATQVANICGAIVVSRHACSAAMPTMQEIDYWRSGKREGKVDKDPVLAHLHRVSPNKTGWNQLCVMAFDHRSQFFEMARTAGAGVKKITLLKKLLVVAAEKVEKDFQLQGQMGVLIDGGDYGADALAHATGRGWWVGRPVELPSSRPLRFDGTRSIGSALNHWPTEQVVKCLVHYHPDDAVDLRLEQEEKLLELWEATRASGNELLIEVIPPKAMTPAGTEDEAILRSIQRLYNLGIKPEWWKLAPMQEKGWKELEHLLAQADPYCRGAVILGLNQPLDYLVNSFSMATNPVVKGFMVGRTLWADVSLAWLQSEISDQQLIDQVSSNFAVLVKAWLGRLAA